MPSDEQTKQSGAQPAKGDEVPPELKETENSTSTKGTVSKGAALTLL